MRGKLGGSAMCICGQGCGSTEACGEYAILLRDLTTATAKIERLRGLLADVMESSLGMTQGAIGRVQSFQDAEAFLTTLEPKDGEL